MRLLIPSLEALQNRVNFSPTAYKKPIEVTHYSLDEHREFRHDRSQLKQYQPASDFYQYSDLRHGFDTFISKPEGLQEYLDVLVLSAKKINFDWSLADIVTWRGVMTKILCTPFSRDPWTLQGNFRNGTIFLVEDKSHNDRRIDRRGRELMYGGFKFESLCMVDTSSGTVSMKERQEQIVNNWSEFGTVFQSALGKHRVFLGAEVDGLDEDGKSYIELKTTGYPNNPHTERTFLETKMMKWWVQSFLAGVPTILVGYRNQRGWVDKLERIPVESIPRRVRGRVKWDPQAILAFGDMFFTWIRQMIEIGAAEETINPVRNAETGTTEGIVGFTVTFNPGITSDPVIELEFTNGPCFI